LKHLRQVSYIYSGHKNHGLSGLEGD